MKSCYTIFRYLPKFSTAEPYEKTYRIGDVFYTIHEILFNLDILLRSKENLIKEYNSIDDKNNEQSKRNILIMNQSISNINRNIDLFTKALNMVNKKEIYDVLYDVEKAPLTMRILEYLKIKV